MDRAQSPAFQMLRVRSQPILRLVEDEIGRRQDGGRAVIWCDQLEKIGSRRVYQQAMSELNALGLLDVERLQKRYVCARSERWRDITTPNQAMGSVLI